MEHPKSITVRFIQFCNSKKRTTISLTVQYDPSFSLDCNVMFARSLAILDDDVYSIESIILNY